MPPCAFAALGMFDFLASLDNLLAFTASQTDSRVPRNYKEAMLCPDLWEEPMKAEVKVLQERQVWSVVPRSTVPANKKVMSCMWVFDNKYNGDGEIIKRKARLIAKGFSQIPGVDFTETYASVVRLESFRMTAAIAAHLGLHVWQVDFVSAYLNSRLQHTVYMDLPPGLVVQGEEPMVFLLDKTLYGMMQGAYDWWHELDGSFRKLGYYQSQADTCVRLHLVNSELTITSTYTDNVFGLHWLRRSWGNVMR